MKKFLVSAFFVVAFGAYATYNYFTNPTNAQSVAATAATPNGASGSIVVTDSTANSAAGASAPPTNTAVAPAKTPTPVAVTPTPVQPPTPKGQYVDGMYTGSAANAYYGNIQVRATISGGKLTNVTFLQYPNDRSTSRYINQQAMPELKAEAIQAQSASVNGVSGASDSSAAFQQSLADALAQAKA
jgi:uncharacterized protein with FMN-binding domain